MSGEQTCIRRSCRLPARSSVGGTSRGFVRRSKWVVSSTRIDFPWSNSHHIAGDLFTGVQKLKDATPNGVLLGSGKLATELDRLDLIDEYKLLVHPRIAGHGPTLYESGLASTRRLELISATGFVEQIERRPS
ncbi:dihydrofolate reductase family protein [Massilia timonae]|uniref:dihydrofolate reductase family protein n=1 Tax=Massilia timonae TaxID=47229 RepID=UPI0023572839|nr:dihydrofolate reductase family protein [Massilia timonae]